MGRKFLEGLVFGAGFSIAFVAIWMAAWFFLLPRIVEWQLPDDIEWHISEEGDAGSRGPTFEQRLNERMDERLEASLAERRPVHAQTVEERIDNADAIAVAMFEPDDDGRMRATITEFLKAGPMGRYTYEIGDEFSSASYYPEEGRYPENRDW